MKKLFILFALLFLVGCTNEEVKTFTFAGEIQKIIVVGPGTNNESEKLEIENAAEINIIENAMQNAAILSEPYTSEGPLYTLEVIYDDHSKEIIDLWYYPSTNKGRFYMDDMYSLNEGTVPELIELFDSYKRIE